MSVSLNRRPHPNHQGAVFIERSFQRTLMACLSGVRTIRELMVAKGSGSSRIVPASARFGARQQDFSSACSLQLPAG